MNEMILPSSDCRFPIAHVPVVSTHPIIIRAATLDDLPFIDGLQKKHSRELGFLPTKALEGKIGLQQCLIAEAVMSNQGQGARDVISNQGQGARVKVPSSLAPCPSLLSTVPAGYLIAADRYFKRDEIGYVTQIGVVPEYRRSLVAGMLLQAQFDRSAYGCKLYCCWCAQDLAANYFWEAMGFTAIAFRTGSLKRGVIRGKGKGASRDGDEALSGDSLASRPLPLSTSARVHIFWQKRIRANDTTTPWWYPSTTGAGEIREDRLVFPIMPGVSWRDVRAITLPNTVNALNHEGTKGTKEHEEDRVATSCPSRLRGEEKPKATTANRKSKIANVPEARPVGAHRTNGFWFEPEKAMEEPAEAPTAKPVKAKKPKEKVKIDPALHAMSRELRDKWTEQIAPAIESAEAKHDVRKALAEPATPATIRMIAA